MSRNNCEKLILLEFFVNKVEFFEGQSKLDKKFLDNLGGTSVKIVFKGCYILEIEEDENCKSVVGECGKRCVPMKSGKSCLLSMDQVTCGCNYTATLTVSRRMPPGECGCFAFGVAKIDLEKIIRYVNKPSTKTQRVKSLRQACTIKDGQGATSGQIDLFVRATSLGKHVVTMFQLGKNDSYYFKGTDVADSVDSVDDSSSAMGNFRQVKGPCSEQPKAGRVGPPQQGQCPCPFNPQPKYQMPMMPWSVQAPPSMGPSPCGEASPPCATYRDEDYEKLDGEYKEISAEVNGYEVKIKLLRRPKKCSE